MNPKHEQGKRSELSSLWRRLDPAHYYDAGEIAILRAYFGLRRRPGDVALVDLYETPSDGAGDDGGSRTTRGPIRLRRIGSGEPVNDLNEAVARICLSDVQERLPQWGLCTDDGVILARARFAAPDRTFTPLNPERLLCINWADSGPGYSWPEEYYVTLLPGFGRYVVTASSDSTDCYGVTDFALGWFRASLDVLTGSRRILTQWWREAAKHDGGPWAYLFDEGLIDSDTAYRLRRRAWPRGEA
jgi:hypothetical protein